MSNELYTISGRKYNLTQEGREVLKQNYSLGYSQIKIAKKFNVSEETIRKWMRENNIPTRKRKHSIDENYFENINSPEKAYWLGFLSADGYVHNQSGQLTLELQECDKEHVEKFAKTVKSSAPLLQIKCGENSQFTHYRYSVKCRKMVDDLKKYNVVQNKSLIFYPINIPNEYFKYWILGYMDGDGCIFKSKNRIKISFTGTQKTLEIIKDFFHSNNIISLEHRCNNTYRFTLEVAIGEKFLSDIKYNELDFVLKRKQMHYCSIIQ